VAEFSPVNVRLVWIRQGRGGHALQRPPGV